MAATALTVQSATHAGLEIQYSAPSQTTGHTAPTGQGVALLVKNGSGATCWVDVHVPGTVDGLAVVTPSGGAAPARRVTVGIGKDEIIPLPQAVYGDISTGLATFDVQAITSLSLACVVVA